MKPLLLALLFLISPQKPASAPTELAKLREEFVKLNNEYKTSLAALLTRYEDRARKVEEKLEHSKRLFAEGVIPRTMVDENERELTSARQSVEETKKQIADADQQVADIFNDAKLDQEYRRAVKQRRRARKPRCTNWTLTAFQRTTANSVSFGYKLVCQN